MEKERFEYFAREIFHAALEVHKSLGPGLLESVYEYALAKELYLRNIEAKYQVKVPLFYKGYETGKEFFLDMLVENEIIVEVKSCEDGIKPVHQAQLLSYLKLAEKKLGFLINFNVVLLKDGFKRLVNNYFT
ncbi:MAG TPA: GxxExxY protein [Chitinophagaceae bacterium]|jgi:GxxExxY protein|nr:GxxExxY protein [Chitinophagaceae bacterium]